MTFKISKSTKLAAGIAAAVLTQQASAIDLGTFGETDVSFKGYVKFDAIMSSYDSGSLASGNIGRDFYIPSLTPVGGDEQTTTVDMHARQTRFGFGTNTDVDGTALKTYIELGFLATPSGNERITNSYEPRMRHAFLTYGNWTFGQTWSTFMNVGALPETLDFIGNTDATIFIRQSQVRYTNGGFQFALENPESTITPYGGGSRIVSDDNSLPDVVARYNYNSGDLSLVAAALVHQLEYNDGDSIDDSTTGYGLSLSGSYKVFGKDDLKFVLNTGSGMGRYIGLNIANGAVLDEDGNLETIDSTAFNVSYRHHWNDMWRSTLSYQTIDIDNDVELTGTSVSSSSESTRLNLIYSPTKKLSLGGELALADREIESGDEGSMTRLQFSAKLSF